MKKLVIEKLYSFIYFAMFVAVIASFIPAAHEYVQVGNVNEAFEMSQIPLLTEKELETESKEIKGIIERNFDSMDQYPVTITRMREFEDKVRKVTYTKQPYAHKAQIFLSQLQSGRARMPIDFENKFGKGAVQKSLEGYTGRTMFDSRPAIENYDTVYTLLKLGYLFTLLIALIYFPLRMRQEGYHLLSELAVPWKMGAIIVAWPVTVWKFPTGDPALILKRNLQWALYFLVTILSCGICGVGTAKAQTKTKAKSRGGTETEYVIEGGIDHIGLEFFPFTAKGGKHGSIMPVYAGHVNHSLVGQLRAFGFYEARLEKVDFTSHTYSYQLPFKDVQFIKGETELGGNQPGKKFMKLGFGVNLQQTPILRHGVQPVFRFASFTWRKLMLGTHPTKEFHVAWKTKDLVVGSFKFFSGGFYKFRPWDWKEYGVPGIFVGHKKIPRTSLGVKFEMLDRKVQTYMFGCTVKLY